MEAQNRNHTSSYLAIAAVGTVAAPQLWEVFLATLPELATTAVEVLTLLVSTRV